MKSLEKILLFLSLLFSAGFGQMMNPLQNPQSAEMPRNPYGHELFTYRVYSFADSSDRRQNRVEFYFAIVNDMLTFIKKSENWYRAKYELSVIFYNKKREVVTYQNIQDTLSVSSFSATNSRQNPALKRFSFSLPPDEYEYKIELYDAETQVNVGRPVTLKLIDYSKPSLQISDLVITNHQTCEDGLRTFAPNLRESFTDEASEVGAYFELYGSSKPDSITVQYSLISAKGQKVTGRSYRIAGGAILPQCFSLKDMISKPGEYTFMVEAQAGSVRVKAERSLFIHWGQVAVQSANIDVAVEQLALISHGHQIQKMRAAPPEERQKLYDQFWRQRDPTPGTEANELRDEFFSRVDFAIRNFSESASGLEGWKSDRGRVLLRYGTPDDIERHATEPTMPAVEIWMYTRLHKRFIFADRQGMGDFRLVKVE